jgi:hypothetical protein
MAGSVDDIPFELLRDYSTMEVFCELDGDK